MTDENPVNFHPVMIMHQIGELQEETQALKDRITAMEQAETAEQKRRLKWGISALGTIVMALGGAVWALLPADAQSAWQLVTGRNR